MFCKFMRNAKESIEKKCIKVDANILLWTFCEFLSINCRKIHFFDLAENVDEAFYQLRYDLKANVSKKGKGKQTEM